MLSKNILYIGRDQPAPEPIPLRAGPLHMLFDQGDLRAIQFGDREILRRVYVAIRDRNWGTIPARLFNLSLKVQEDAFAIDYDVENQQSEIAFTWHGKLRGAADGRVTFAMDGTARSTFLKNRIGFCVLFPASDAGQPVTIEHTTGSREQAAFPEDISADQPVRPFDQIRAIRLLLGRAGEAMVRFEGDVFEMEDQRLWTDASYKIYCTPLSLPYPVEIQAGTPVAQKIELALNIPRGTAPVVIAAGVSGAPQNIEIAMPPESAWKPMPRLGLGVASHGQPLRKREIARLKDLHLHHLRVDLPLADRNYPQRLARAAREAAELGAEASGIGLEVSLLVSADGTEDELRLLRMHLDELSPPVCGWLVYPAQEIYAGGSPIEPVLRAARRYLEDFRPGIPFAAGTNADLIFLKRTLPPLALMDQVCIAMTPQVHAFDERSLVETLEAQPMVGESARRLAGGLPLVVSPITLKPRFNAYATGPIPPVLPGTLPTQVDPRQLSLFGAGWTLGSLRAMLSAGAVRVTYYETTGWRGVMEQETGSSLPQVFASLSGAVFPLYHVLADYGFYANGHGAPLHSSDAFRISGLALRRDQRMAILLANHTPEPQTLVITGLQGAWQIRTLDQENALQAMQSPEAYPRDFTGRLTSPTLLLPPYAYLHIQRVTG